MKTVIRNNLFIFGYIVKYAPSYIPCIFLSAVVQALAAVLEVLGIKYIIEALEKGNHVRFIIVILAYIFLSLVVNEFTKWTFYYFPLLAEKVSRGMTIERMSASQKLDFQCYDIPEFQDAYTRALNSGEQQVNMLIGALIAIVSNVTTLVSVAIIIAGFSLWLVLIAVVQTVVSFYVIVKKNKLDYSYNYNIVPLSRKQGYFKTLCFSPEVQMEDRIFGVVSYAKEKYNDIHSIYLKELKKHLCDLSVYEYVEVAISSLLIGLSMVILGSKVSAGRLMISEFIASLNGVKTMTSQLLSLVVNFPKLSQISRYTADYRKIVEYEPIIEKKGVFNQVLEQYIRQKDIVVEFRNVSFHYPKADKNILNNVSFCLRNSQKYAIVGENGVGKTTIVKLLLRLYDPTEGTILCNGIDIREFDVKQWRSMFTSIFQDFSIYSTSLEDNIWFLSKGDTVRYLSKVGLEKFSNTSQYSRSVTRRFASDGIVLSGGEAQRLCIARALGKDSGIAVMDEPSSSLDPMIEDDIVKIVLEETKYKTLLIITHRLSMCRYVDRIFCMDNGTIIEQGTHRELLNLRGKYYTLFQTQAEKYDSK